MPWICPDCGYSNSDYLLKCHCGHESELIAKANKDSGDEIMAVSTCSSCKKEIPKNDKFCPFCGVLIRVLSKEEKQKIRKASKWILAISILFVVFGTFFGFMQKSNAKDAKKNLAQFDDSYVWEAPIYGKEYTVGELRAQIDNEVVLVFVTNYFLAIVMFGLYLWARTSPFPAMITALCVYLVVIVLNAVIDPKTIIQGIIIKIIFISALIAGIKASLVARGLSKSQLNM